MSVVLVNGDGNPAVHASQDADFIGGISGQETGILDINDKFAATIADANTVEISSGVCITKEGRRIQIDVGDVEEVTVPTGSQGTTKYYIIGFHLYTDGSGNQLAETFIDEVESSTATITEKMFKDGETEVYVSLYRITRNGLNLEGLTLILPEIGSLAGGGIIGNTDISGIADGTVTGAVAQINTDLTAEEGIINNGNSYLYYNKLSNKIAINMYCESLNSGTLFTLPINARPSSTINRYVYIMYESSGRWARASITIDTNGVVSSHENIYRGYIALDFII